MREHTLTAVEKVVAEGMIPGATVGLYEEGEWHFAAYGKRGTVPPFDQQALTGQEVYDLASLTKVVGTTTRILQLADEGQLSLAQPVNQLLPELPFLTMSVSDLLLHRSGLPADYPKELIFDEDHLVAYLAACDFEKAGETCYSDLGFLVLGWLIEELTGETLEESEQAHIFRPLGMTHTGYYPETGEVFVPTEVTAERGVIAGTVHDSKAFRFPRPAGSAGLFATMADLSRFCQALLTNRCGNEGLFSPELYQQLLQTDLGGRSLGWEKPWGSDVLYHTGFTGTAIGWSPQQQKALILLTNRIHPLRQDHGFLSKRIEIYQSFFEV